MKKNNVSLKQTFAVALDNYRKGNFSVTENICNKILSINSDNFDSLVLLANVIVFNKNFKKAIDLLV